MLEEIKNITHLYCWDISQFMTNMSQLMIAYTLSHPFYMHAQLSSGARSVKFGWINLCYFFMCISSDGFDEIALLCRLNWAFNARQMRAHIVILDQSRSKHWSRSNVDSIFTFLVSNIHYSLWSIAGTCHCKIYNSFLSSFIFFFVKKAKVIIK